MSQAIEASLNYEMHVDPPDDRTLADRLRHGDRLVVQSGMFWLLQFTMRISPVALCPSQSTFIYAAMVLHALFFIPQVREYVASYRPAVDSLDGITELTSIVRPPTSGPGIYIFEES